jgi:ketosteroid isomerase-like protein
MRSKVFLALIPAIVVASAAAHRSALATPPNAAESDSAAVAKVVNEFHAALEKGDSATALRLLSSDALILESGAIEPRSEYRSHHLPADIEFAMAVAEKRGPIQVHVKGNVAWTAGTSETKGEFKGRAIDSTGAESMVLTKEVAGWRIQSIHWSSRRRSTRN